MEFISRISRSAVAPGQCLLESFRMRLAILVASLLALASCAKKEADLKPALDSINAESLMANIRKLSSDEFEGRAPGTHGEQLTVDFITSEFRKLGLEPGNPDGSYVQKAPLVGITSKTGASFSAGGRKLSFTPREEFVASSHRAIPEVKTGDTDIVFVGYGIVAPEYGWDDFKDVDVKGKTILVLVNDPPLPDEKMFRGRAMTYYGRWTYKYEIASEKGAAAAIIIHETGPAGYPFAVVGSRWGREEFDIYRDDKNMGRVPVEGWISYDKAAELAKMAGQDLAALKQAALSKDFRPVPLKASASFTVSNTVRRVESSNVIARLPGSDPAHRDEYVIYTAHWDHLGRDESLQGDQIFNGALDNASGSAGLLEIAKAYKQLDPAPKRSILFLALTAEEKGLLGAKYYAQNPLYPLNKTLAVFNMDGLNQWGPTHDYVIIGLGNSTLDDIVSAVARDQGRVIKPDPEPEKGFFYRSDHFEFAKEGVPALHTDSGTEFIGKPADYGQKKRDEYTNNDYHKVSDEVKPDWDLRGAVEDLRLLFQSGYRVSQSDSWPEWKPGTEFKAKREATLK